MDFQVMDSNIAQVVTLLSLAGIICLVLGVFLIRRYFRSRIKEGLALSLIPIFYAAGSLTWVVIDTLAINNTILGKTAWVFILTPAYFGVLFLSW